ncbi:peptide-methionine (S)-S-oxide reductase MsrA [Novosphingobium sp. Leaf2]|uniref:peptide-methionine (S)-S-oxide reductase MsrA n=1 Tax=Novosphingobium sp. Leaf2 TaxID=1735670 RepID=UPI0006FFB12C|nr:peptide-methionine (S)-S-oxide reductase MsrA [Novosphingobium sp. Leaf2]KQM19668.1 methionine sulfoxide reductase A [Novosphingobium sp. Leaf2]
MPVRTLPLAAAAAVLGLVAVAAGSWPSTQATAANFPAPPSEPAASGDQVAVLAGGCFWGIEGVFEHVRGVKSVTAGYAGGSRADATYRAVSTEKTGHAESVRIVYDPREVSYGTLLKIFFSVAHDPTQVNRQFPDSGPSYRSAIFPQSPQQRQVAAAYIAALNKAHVYDRPIATRLETGNFYPAESYHQDYLRRNPDNGYIVRYDAPKLAALRKTWPTLWRT